MRRQQAAGVVCFAIFLMTVTLWISGGMSAMGYLPLLSTGGISSWLTLKARRERLEIGEQLEAARTFQQLPAARVVE